MDAPSKTDKLCLERKILNRKGCIHMKHQTKTRKVISYYNFTSVFNKICTHVF